MYYSDPRLIMKDLRSLIIKWKRRGELKKIIKGTVLYLNRSFGKTDMSSIILYVPLTLTLFLGIHWKAHVCFISSEYLLNGSGLLCIYSEACFVVCSFLSCHICISCDPV